MALPEGVSILATAICEGDGGRVRDNLIAPGAMKIVISDMPPYFLDLDAPTVPAYQHHGEDGRTLWGMWCDYCQRWHWHGQGEGHRIEHCHDPRSPYAKHGYKRHGCHTVGAQDVQIPLRW